jgi:hypothetical protein
MSERTRFVNCMTTRVSSSAHRETAGRTFRSCLRSCSSFLDLGFFDFGLCRQLEQDIAVAAPDDGCVVAIPQVGGLHHRYERRAKRSARPAPQRPSDDQLLRRLRGSDLRQGRVGFGEGQASDRAVRSSSQVSVILQCGRTARL